MIRRVWANSKSFKSVSFRPGLNVIIADRTEDSEQRDTRNGLGKSTLIEIIHFCLGAGVAKGRGLLVESLSEWIFSLDLILAGEPVTISRSIRHPSEIRIIGDAEVSEWPMIPRRDLLTGEYVLTVDEWTSLLGVLVFDLPQLPSASKYQPTFRGLIPYFIRRGRDAYSSPFEHHRRQGEGDKQVYTTFLLGLAWDDASEWQVLKDRRKLIEELGKAAREGLINIFGSRGELEAAKVRLENRAQQEAEALQTFRVLPQYRAIEARANKLTEDIHQAVNANLVDTRLLGFYKASIEEEHEPSLEDVNQLYMEAGVSLPNAVLKRLQDVQYFHRQLVENRRQFLSGEIERLESAIAQRVEQVGRATEERAELLILLRTHGALDEYTRLNQLHLNTLAQVKEFEARINTLRQFEEQRTALQLDIARLQGRARANYEALWVQRSKAIELFNANSETLYNAPGTLAIDIGPNGYQFKVEIERSGSTGIENMKVFCYDLMMAELWAQRNPSPCLLIHDSLIFDGVDERQRALALELAASKANEHNFPYVCTLNSDTIPWSDFSPDFDFDAHVVLRLTDATEDGRLLGLRF